MKNIPTNPEKMVLSERAVSGVIINIERPTAAVPPKIRNKAKYFMHVTI